MGQESICSFSLTRPHSLCWQVCHLFQGSTWEGSDPKFTRVALGETYYPCWLVVGDISYWLSGSFPRNINNIAICFFQSEGSERERESKKTWMSPLVTQSQKRHSMTFAIFCSLEVSHYFWPLLRRGDNASVIIWHHFKGCLPHLYKSLFKK